MKALAKLAAVTALSLGVLGIAAQADAQPGPRRGRMAQGDRPCAMEQSGQRPEGRGDPLAGLDLTDEQKAQIDQLRADMRAQMEEWRASGERPTAEEIEAQREAHRAALAEILTAEQLATLDAARPERQEQGMRGGRPHRGPGPDEGLAEALGLTEEQQAALQALREEHRAAMEEARASGVRPTAEEMEAQREAHRAALAEILTEEQLAKLDELRGPHQRPAASDSETGDAAPKAAAGALESSSWGQVKNTR